MKSKAQETYDDLRDKGFSAEAIKDFACDGEALAKTDLDQDDAEELYSIATKEL